MLQVNFHDNVDDNLLTIAAVVTQYNHNWVFCRVKTRNTFEIPAGHREPHETILEAAKRELYEETGAIDFTIHMICPYSVLGTDNLIHNQTETFGMLYFAVIKEFGPLPPFEVEEVIFSVDIPSHCTYPLVQPRLIEKALDYLSTAFTEEHL